MTANSLNRLRLTNYKLKVILNITNAINKNASVNNLISIFKNVLVNDLNINKVSIYRYNGNRWKSILDVGVKKRFLEDIDFTVLQAGTEITIIKRTNNKKLQLFDFIIPIFHKNTPLGYVFIGDINEIDEIGISPSIKHLNFIQIIANILMVAAENKRLFRESLQQISIKKEMELAAKMQKMLIPNNAQLPNNKQLTISAYYQPYSEIGGDYYDYIEIDENNIAFCIADVSGKGTSAALLMSNFQANLRALLNAETSLVEIVTKLNNRIINITNNDKFITLFLGKYNLKTKKLNYINCGHIPPIVYNKQTQSIFHLRKGTIGIGMLSKIPKIQEGIITINSEIKIICFTDGLTETEDAEKQEFGVKPIEAELKKDNTIEDTINNIILNLNSYNKKQSIFDDVTMLGIRLSS